MQPSIQQLAMAEQMISVGAEGVGAAFDTMASKIPVVGSALGGLAKAGVVVAGAMLGAFVGAIKKTLLKNLQKYKRLAVCLVEIPQFLEILQTKQVCK